MGTPRHGVMRPPRVGMSLCHRAARERIPDPMVTTSYLDYLDDPTRYVSTVVHVTHPLVRDRRRPAHAQRELARLLVDLGTQIARREPQALTGSERTRLHDLVQQAKAELLKSEDGTR